MRLFTLHFVECRLLDAETQEIELKFNTEDITISLLLRTRFSSLCNWTQ